MWNKFRRDITYKIIISISIKLSTKTRTQMRNCNIRNDIFCVFMILPFMAIQYLFKTLCMFAHMLDYIHDGYYNILSPYIDCSSIFGMAFCDIGLVMIGTVVIVILSFIGWLLHLKYMGMLY